MRLSELRQQVADGKYRVDSQAVAEAIVRRLLAGRTIGPSENGRSEDRSA
jgi:hypothetical protein